MQLRYAFVLGILLVSHGRCDISDDHCGEELNVSRNGSISSPNAPNGYPLNLQCEWIITVPHGMGISIELDRFNTDSKGNGGGDVLHVFESMPGSLNHGKHRRTWQFSGHVDSGRTISTRSNKLWLLFQSDGLNGGGTGFRLLYRPYNLNECPDPGGLLYGERPDSSSYPVGQEVKFSCDPGYTLNGHMTIKCVLGDGGHPQWSQTKPSCTVTCLANRQRPGRSFVYLVPTNVFTVLSPNYPNSYGGNELCTWEIRPELGQKVNISMQDFDLSSGRGTYLEIWDGSWSDILSDEHNVRLIGNYTGTTFPTSIISTGNVALKFKSGSVATQNRHGFKLIYNVVHDIIMDSSRCIKPMVPLNMYYLPLKDHYNPGDKVQYRCNEGFYLSQDNNNNTVNACSLTKLWTIAESKDLPRCIAACRYWNKTISRYARVVLTNSSGVIYSKGYPDTLKKGICGYMISLNPGKTASLYFRTRNLVPGLVISIYESTSVTERGTELLQITGTSSVPESIRSTKNIINIIVNMTSNEPGGQFALVYDSSLHNRCVDPPLVSFSRRVRNGARNIVGSTVSYECDPFFMLVGSSTIKCVSRTNGYGWNATAPVCVRRCGGDYVATNGTIAAPYYPSEECVWNITDPSYANPYIITVTRLRLSPSDTLHIRYQGDNGFTVLDIAALCPNGDCLLPVSPHLTFEVRFTSDITGDHSSSSRSEFALSFRLLMGCPYPDAPINGIVIGDDSSASSDITYECNPPYELIGATNASCKPGPDGRLAWNHPPPRCEVIDCQVLDGKAMTRFAGHGSIVNYGYPSMNLKANQDCTWQIQAVSGGAVQLHFRYLDLPGNSATYVELFDGADDRALIDRYTAHNVPRNITSRTSFVTVHYRTTDRDFQGYRGFYLEYDETVFASVAPPTTEITTKAIISSKTTALRTSPTTVLSTESTPGSTLPSKTTSPLPTTKATTKTPMPTTAPSTVPITTPTTSPSTVPTTAPTTAQATVPITTPTTAPSTVSATMPTTAPSTVQTTMPTTAPSTAPTTTPTAAPSTVPTTTPTATPSTVPTTIPTAAPSTVETTLPTSATQSASPTFTTIRTTIATIHTKPSPRPSQLPSTSARTPSTTTTFPVGGRSTTSIKPPVVPPTMRPSASVIPVNNTDGGIGASSQTHAGVNSGVIAAAVVIPVLALIVGGIGFVMWYRKKYPVRMTFGRHFGKFSNPAYDNHRPSGVGHNLSLVRDPSSPLPNYGQENRTSVLSNGTAGQTNDAFTFDFEKEINCNGTSTNPFDCDDSGGNSNGEAFA